MKYTIDNINQLSQSDFVERFGAVFEETPAIASQAWAKRPFADISDLHQKMVDVVENTMTPAEKIDLIYAHPELGKKGKMAEASVREQAGAGLSQLDAAGYQRIQALNRDYREKFGFPFVMAVKGFAASDVLAAFEERVRAKKEEETVRSLTEIYKIARLRLKDIVTD
ncbi:MAG: 2-oxo-4-hydroxy-4-carboxy-5-ureidoimidazoline decarboxylase [Phormidesmis sp.]